MAPPWPPPTKNSWLRAWDLGDSCVGTIHISLNESIYSILQGGFHLTQPHPHAGKCKHGPSSTIMPSTTNEFNVIPKTQRTMNPGKTKRMRATWFPPWTTLVPYKVPGCHHFLQPSSWDRSSVYAPNPFQEDLIQENIVYFYSLTFLSAARNCSPRISQNRAFQRIESRIIIVNSRHKCFRWHLKSGIFLSIAGQSRPNDGYIA